MNQVAVVLGLLATFVDKALNQLVLTSLIASVSQALDVFSYLGLQVGEVEVFVGLEGFFIRKVHLPQYIHERDVPIDKEHRWPNHRNDQGKESTYTSHDLKDRDHLS